MADVTAISWADHTWNPWQGCRKVSQGCKHCYMYRAKERYGQEPYTVVRSSAATFRKPLTWKVPALVFACSWSDWFIEYADPWREEAWAIIRQAPHLTFMLLTKRPENIASRLPSDWGAGYPNIWLGVSVENQRAADERIPLLLQVPAAVRFLSCEPLLEAVDLWPYLKCAWEPGPMLPPRRGTIGGKAMPAARLRPRIDWVIVGGESGPKARPMELDWARSLRDQCIAAGVPFFFKQESGPRPGHNATLDGQLWHQFPEAQR